MATKCETWAAELVALKSKTSSLIGSFNSASVSVLGFLSAFRNNFGKYNCGEDLDSQAMSIQNFISNDNPTQPQFLTVTFNLIQLDAGKCKGGSLNCSKDGCIASVGSVNSSLANYFNSRKALVDNLKAIQSKESQIANDAECKAAQQQQTQQNLEDQEKNRQIRNGIIWFVVVSAVIGVSVYLWKKYVQ